MAESGTRSNRPALRLHIPEPMSRADAQDFGAMEIPKVGSAFRPDIYAAARDVHPLAYSLVRVLDDDDQAVGPWDPRLSRETMLRGLRAMMLTRGYDERMYRAQRQGKTSFYMKSTGEEAVSVAQALALQPDDMCFPTYRQQGVLIARGYPLLTMMNQVYSNAEDPLKGRQLPVMYSSAELSFFSISGNLGTQFSQAVGWAMASAYKGDDRIAATWIGEGSTAEGDFHHALTFASVYRAPVILSVVNNQWAISSFSGIAGSEQATFAARGIGYGLPTLRVDGNDFLAVHAVTQWAAERARANLGATLIEHFTYRVESHSTSDDPSRYRAKDAGERWPLGDPIKRLSQHMIAIGEWSDERQHALQAEVTAEIRAASSAAERIGTLGMSRPDLGTMFDDVYKELPWHLRRQRDELMAQKNPQSSGRSV